MRKWLFHRDHPAKIFIIESQEQLDELYGEGWCETDAHFDKPEPEPEPEREPLGDIQSQLIGLVYSNHRQEFADQLEAHKAELTKDDLKTVADEINVYVMKAWKHETMVRKIVEAVNGGNTEAGH